MSSRHVTSFFTALVLILVACGESTDVATPPSITIVSPSSGSIEVQGDIVLEASASDAEDGDISGQVAWSSDLDGNIGTGAAVTAALSAGDHAIRATITDSEGLGDTASVAIEVVPAPEAVTDLVVVSTNDSTVLLTWTEVSDGLDAPAEYDVRYGESPIDPTSAAEATEGSCAAVSGSSVGAEISCEVTGLAMGTTHGFFVAATRELADASTAIGPQSDVVTTTTDFVEDFSTFSAGTVPTAPHDGFTYDHNHDVNTITVEVVDEAPPLSDRPLLLTKGDAALAGAPNFLIVSNSELGLMYGPSGTVRMMFDLVPTTDSACQLIGIRPDAGPPAWIDVRGSGAGGDFVVDEPYQIVITLDIDAGTVSATRDGSPYEIARWSDDSSEVLRGMTLDYPYQPQRFTFEGCSTAAQGVAIDNIRFELRKE